MDIITYLEKKHNIKLNNQQKEAVLTVDGAILLLAVPGSGKTTVMIARIGNMIINHSIKPEEILTLTFSVAATRDMQERFIAFFEDIIDFNLEFKTIHSFSNSVIKEYERLLNKKAFDIIEDNSSILRQIYLRLYDDYIGEDVLKEIIQKITYCKNMMFDEKCIKNIKIPSCDFERIFNEYEECKKRNRLMDFDDMLKYAYIILKNYPDILLKYQNQYRYINVDEAQDTSYIQHEIIRLLAHKNENIFVVGDEDQSIYGFRAAYPKMLLDFEKIYKNVKVLRIEQNYRSTKKIIEAANRIIKQNKERYPKNMFCENMEGTDIKETKLNNLVDQYKYIAEVVKKEGKNKELAVLYRNNDSAIPIIDEFERNRISFYIKDNKPTFFTHFVTNDIKNFIRLSQNTANIEAFGKIYYKMNSGISKAMFEYVRKNIRNNVFDTLLAFPDLNDGLKIRIEKIQTEFEQLRNLQALKAIECIESKIGYLFYLSNLANEGYSKEGLIQKMNIIKSISVYTDTIDELLNRLSELEEIIQNSNNIKPEATLTTIHSSKGLEFDKVILIDILDGIFPSYESVNLMIKNADRALYEEEVRLFYVGITRARKEIEVITSDFLFDKRITMSRFVENLFVKQNEYPIYTKNVTDIDKDKMSRYCVDVRIMHKKFGEGIITLVRDDIIEVFFKNIGSKTLSLSTCIRMGIIEFIPE